MAEDEIVTIERIDPSRSDSALSPRTEVMSWRAALESILAGTARLAAVQPEPPLALLSEVLAMIGRVEALGPPAPNGPVYIKCIEKLTVSDVRRDVVDGHAIPWREGPDSITRLGENCWADVDHGGPSALTQLRAVLETHLNRLALWPIPQMPSAEAMRRDRLIHVPQILFVDVEKWPEFRKPAPDWFEFHLGLQELDAKLQAAINQGLSEGRILAFEERGAPVVRLAPSRHLSTHPRWRCWYILTRDLPESWFHPSIDVKAARVEALAWLRRVGRFYTGKGKRIPRDSAIHAMQLRFNLKKYAATRVWDNNAHPSKGAVGKIPRGQEVNLEDLMSKT